jgi:hypothetical protein
MWRKVGKLEEKILTEKRRKFQCGRFQFSFSIFEQFRQIKGNLDFWATRCQNEEKGTKSGKKLSIKNEGNSRLKNG